MIPALLSRWSVRRFGGVNVWQVVRMDGAEFVLRCIEAVADKFGHAVGDEITVERAWFEVRGRLGANIVGAVRAVAA